MVNQAHRRRINTEEKARSSHIIQFHAVLAIRRKNTEEKAKIVAFWGTEFIKFLAVQCASCFAVGRFEEQDECILLQIILVQLILFFRRASLARQ